MLGLTLLLFSSDCGPPSLAFSLVAGPTAGPGRPVRVAVYQNEPKVFFDEQRRAAGLFMELLERIAAEEGWTLQFVPCEWPDCLRALTAGKLDLVPDVAYSPERDATYDFHRTPVLESWSRVYAAPQSRIFQLHDLHGKRVAVLRESIQQEVFEQLMSGFGYRVEVIPAASFAQAFELAATGQADAAIANHLFGDYFHQKQGLARTAIDFNPVKLYYATAEGQNADLLAAIDRRLDEWVPQRGSPYYSTLGKWTAAPRFRVPPAVFWIIGGIGGLLFAATGATALLRRQVKLRTQHLEHLNAELRKSEQRYQTLAQISPVGIFRTDANGSTTYVNPQWCALTGLSPADALGNGWLHAVHPEDRETLRQGWQEAIHSQQPSFSDYRFLRPDGTVAWVMGQAVPEVDAAGRVSGWVGTVTDITHRKHAEEDIRRYNAELEALNTLGEQVNRSVSLEDGVSNAIACLVELTHTEVAYLFLRDGERLILAGIGPPEAASRFEQIPEHRVGECMCGLAAQQARPFYSRDIFGDPRCTWEECKKAQYRSLAALPLLAGGQVIGVVGLACSEERDFETQAEFLETLAAQVSGGIRNAQLYAQVQQHAAELERRVVERTAELNVAMRKALEADRLKSAFLATMSHELRTPLNSIIGFTGMLLMKLAGPLTPEQEKQLNMVQDSARHLLDLINDVLDISKIEANQIELGHKPFDLRAAIQKCVDTIAPLAEKKGLRLTAAIGPGVGEIVGDRRRVEQVLLNLLNNSVKFTERGGVHVACDVEPDRLIVRVSDTGIGIRPENQDAIFRPFWQVDSGITRQYEGTGLGLFICKRLVELMGGHIWVESEWGRGTTFSFSLPWTDETPRG